MHLQKTPKVNFPWLIGTVLAITKIIKQVETQRCSGISDKKALLQPEYKSM